MNSKRIHKKARVGVWKICISLTCYFLFLLITENSTGLYAQIPGVLHANPDNVFIDPGARKDFNILLNDALGGCSESEVNITIITDPVHSTAFSVVPISNRLRYRAPDAGVATRDSLQYRLECGGTTSTAWVYIHIRNQPDNTYTDVCHVPIPEVPWNIQNLATSDKLVSALATPLCGDIDNDGKIEIIVPSGTSNSGRITRFPNRLYIFQVDPLTNGLSIKDSITTPPFNALCHNYAIANVDDDGYAAIFLTTHHTVDIDPAEPVTAYPRQLIKYRYNGTRYVEQWRRTYSNNILYSGGYPLIADFSGTGRAQVQVYDKIYDARSGVLLVDGGMIPSSGKTSEYHFGRMPHEGHESSATLPTGSTVGSFCVLGDIDNDGLPEIVAGNCVYKVTITDPDNMVSGNTFKRITKMSALSVPADGAVALADMNNDGQLDVILTCTNSNTDTAPPTPNASPMGWLCIYNPRTGALMSNVITNIPVAPESTGSTSSRFTIIEGPSTPFIGDLDNDGKPEIALTGKLTMRAYSYNAATSTITQMWDITTTDASASTTMSLFDFTQNGSTRLVYRDEENLRIINGVDGSTIKSFSPAASTTGNEYPIIADVNNDGFAEIVVTAALGRAYSGYLYIYASDPIGKWAPARTVWNQFGYNPVYINEDLTVPQYPLNPATHFVRRDGTLNQPFNNFLQQATMMNDEGDMLWLGADLAFDNTRRASIKYETGTDRAEFTIYVTNKGDADFNPPLRVSAYVYDTPGNQVHEIAHIELTETVAVGEFKTLKFYLNSYSSLPFPAYWDHWLIILNGKNNVGYDMPDFPYGEEECHYWNNYTSNISFSYGERVMCEGATELVTIIPENTYKFYWYRTATEPDANYFHIGDTCTLTKNGDEVEMFFIDVYSDDGTKKLTPVRDTAFIYLAPDTLIWTGLGSNADWHNPDNWFNPEATVPNPYPNANIPRRCTNVLIPDNIDTYPDLAPSTRISNATVYSIAGYTRSECANITFEHGGEIARQDSLVYDSAYVHLTLDANRWYMLAAPLQKTFTGDYYQEHPNPYEDPVFVYTRLFAQPNPETGISDEDAWGWTGLFHNPDYLMHPGEGLSFWVDNKEDIDSVSSHLFPFPKHDAAYIVYDRYGKPNYITDNLNRGDTVTTNAMERNGLIIDPPHPIGKEHRFIYESTYDPVFGDVSLYASTTLANEDVIVGNPFMSHLDFEEFYITNSGWINNYYRILDKTDGNFILYMNGGISTATPPLNRYIPPMQAFLVKSKTAFPLLYANADMMTGNRPNEKLRSASDGESNATGQLLTMEVFRDKQENKTLLYYSPDGTDPYGEHVRKIFLKHANKAVNIYTTEYDNDIPLDFHYLRTLDNTVIPIGIRTSEKGLYRINFAGLNEFAPEYEIYLTDMGTPVPVRYNIRAGSLFEFEKTSDEVFENRRFLLSFQRHATGTGTAEQATPQMYGYAKEGHIRIATLDNSLIGNVRIYDMQGKMLVNKENIHLPETEIAVPSEGIYLVVAASPTCWYTGKIYVK